MPDGALPGLHFAVRRSPCGYTPGPVVVFVLDPYRLLDHLKSLPDYEDAKTRWKAYREANPGEDLSSDEWNRAYLPGDEEDQKNVPLSGVPLLSDTTQITRRIAAQRNRFMIFHGVQHSSARCPNGSVATLETLILPVSHSAEIRFVTRLISSSGSDHG